MFTSLRRGLCIAPTASTLHRGRRGGHLDVKLRRVGKGGASNAVAAECFGRYRKARGRMVSDPALCTDTLLFGLPQQAQTDGDKRQDNADDGLAAQQAAGNDQTLLLEGGVLGSPLLV